MSPLRMLLITTAAATLVSACERAQTSASAPVTPGQTAAGSPGASPPASGSTTIPSLQTATIAPAPSAPVAAAAPATAAAPPAACPPVATPVCPPAKVAETVVEERVRAPAAKATKVRRQASASGRVTTQKASTRRVSTQKAAKRHVVAKRHVAPARTGHYASGQGSQHGSGRYEAASIAPGFREGSRSRSVYSYSYQESSRSSVRSYSEDYRSGALVRQDSGYASSYGSSHGDGARAPIDDCLCDPPMKYKDHRRGAAYISPPRHHSLPPAPRHPAPRPPAPRPWAGEDYDRPGPGYAPPSYRPSPGRDHESTYSRGYIGDGRAYR